MLADRLKFIFTLKINKASKNDTTGEYLFGLSVGRMFATKSAVFTEFQFIGRCPLVFCRRVISSFALIACKGNDYSHR
jgi:hypothetical protein